MNTNTIPNILLQAIPYLLHNGEFFSTNLNNQCDPQHLNDVYHQLLEGNNVNLEDIGVGGVIELLKKFFVEQKPVAFANEVRDKFIEIERLENRIEKFQELIDTLPLNSVMVVDYMLYFSWTLIHDQETVNPVMLARFLVPLLFINSPNQLIESQLLVNVVNDLILHYNELFKNIIYIEKTERKPAEPTDTINAFKDKTLLHSHLKKTSKAVKILSLDGGGVRGLVLVTILSKIAEILFGNSDEEGTHKLLDCFDLVCGTSTGGILSVALTSGFSLKRARQTYYLLSSKVFPTRYFGFPIRWSRYYWSGDYYDSTTLINIFKDEFGDKVFTTLHNNLFLTATDATNKLWQSALIRNYNNHSSPYPSIPDVSIPQGLRITSAAPTFFSPVKLNNKTYIDGGVIANNPTEIGIFEAHNKWPDQYIDLILSVGTGIPVEGKGYLSIYGLVNGFVNITTSSEEIHHRVEDWLKLTKPEPSYFRFSPPEVGSVPLDESSVTVLEAMEKKTAEYMDAHIDVIHQLAQHLKR